MTDHFSCDNYPVEVGKKFWSNDLRIVEIIEVAPRPGNKYSDTGCTQTWHKTVEGNGRRGSFDTLDGSMRPYGRLVRYFEGKDAEKYEPGTNYSDIK